MQDADRTVALESLDEASARLFVSRATQRRCRCRMRTRARGGSPDGMRASLHRTGDAHSQALVAGRMDDREADLRCRTEAQRVAVAEQRDSDAIGVDKRSILRRKIHNEKLAACHSRDSRVMGADARILDHEVRVGGSPDGDRGFVERYEQARLKPR